VKPSTSLDARRVRALEQIASVLRWTAAVVATMFVVWLLGDVLLLVFAAALFALGLRGLADRLSDTTGMRSGASLTIVVLALVIALGLGTWWAGPRLVTEASQLQDQMLRQMEEVRAWLDGSSWGREVLRQLPAALGGSAEGGNLVPRISGTIAGALWSAIGLLGTTVLIIAAALYFAAAPGPYVKGPLRLIPHRHRHRTQEIVGEVGHTLQAWLAGQLVDMLVVGLVIGAGLALLGVPLPFILGVIAALLNFVPYIGAIGGAVPAVLVAFSQGPQQALFVAILFVVVQALEGNVLSPMIQRSAVNLPPAATILAQTALGALFGLPGIILATPVAAATLAALRESTSDAASCADPFRSGAKER
jgi:predicted PurR-regulated permease PerM